MIFFSNRPNSDSLIIKYNIEHFVSVWIVILFVANRYKLTTHVCQMFFLGCSRVCFCFGCITRSGDQ